jgi:hypothetical protein
VGAQRHPEAGARDAIRKSADATLGKPSKAKVSIGPDEDLNAWDFIRVGLALTVVAIAVLAACGRYDADFIPSALFVLALSSIAIWGGLTLVAIPTLLFQRMRRALARRRSKSRAETLGTWDDWIDGPGPGKSASFTSPSD